MVYNKSPQKLLREPIGLFALILVLSTAFVYLWVTISETGVFTLPGGRSEANFFLNVFQRQHAPQLELNFSDLYGENGQFQVLHPLLEMRKLRTKPSSLACNDKGEVFDDTVLNNDLSINKNLYARESKIGILSRYLNRQGQLPSDFLNTAPFVDGWGSSFAYLLMQAGPKAFQQKKWIQQHLAFFKTSELPEVLYRFQIDDPRFLVISRLSESEIEDIILGDPIVLTKDYLLIKNQAEFGFSPLSYWVYNVEDLHYDLKDSKYELTPLTPGALCIEKIGNTCWTYSPKNSMAYLYRYSMAILVLLLLLILTFLYFYWSSVRRKNREQIKQRLSLQVLSHEFRTPVSAMMLLIEEWQRNQTAFSQADQDRILRISAEIFRLQRIIELSSTYLQTESGGIQFKKILIPSINEWMADIAAQIDPEIQCEGLKVDQEILTDPFWLKFIVSNLLQNALSHGSKPIEIKLRRRNKGLEISVVDHGNCEFSSLKQMSQAFVKSSKSKGMGLGLNMIEFILDEWKTKLRFTKNPTSFSILIKI